MDKALRLQVIFSAIDKLSGPIRSLGAGSKRLTADLAATRKEITSLQRAQAQLGKFKDAETRYAAQAKALEAQRAKTAALREEIARTEAPTRKMTAALARAEKEEKKLTERHEQQGRELQDLSRKLEATGVDVAELGRHEDRLAGKVYDANKRLEEQQQRLARINRARKQGEKIRGAGDGIAGAGGTATMAITAPLIAFGVRARAAAKESLAAEAQVRSALESMGNASKKTFDQLDADAGRLQSLSTFDDDDIMRNLTAPLLTFRKISGPTFDRAQQAALDVAVAFKKDLFGSAVMVGKALNDPVKGVTALTRVGVSFTEQQKKQIKAMVKANNIAGAQALILKELEAQSKGSAFRQRQAAGPDADAVDQWRRFEETVGKVIIAVLPPLTAALTDLLAAFNSLTPEQQAMLVKTMMLAAAFGPLLLVVGNLVKGFGFLWPLLARAGPLFITTANGARTAGPAIRLLGLAFRFLLGPIGLVLTILALLGLAIYKNWDTVKAAFNSGVTFLAALPVKFMSIGGQLIQGLINGITGKLSALKNTIVNAATAASDWFRKKLGIKSPSRVFMGLGGHIMAGLDRGIADGENSPVRRLEKLSRNLAAAIAVGTATPAIAASSPPAGPAAAGAGAAGGSTYVIQIYQQPGQSAEDLAKAVAAEIDRRERQREAASRSSYRDED